MSHITVDCTIYGVGGRTWRGQAVLDSGCDCNCIEPHIISSLVVSPTGQYHSGIKGSVSANAGTDIAYNLDVETAVSGRKTLPFVKIERRWDRVGCEVVLGNPILRLENPHIDYRMGRVSPRGSGGSSGGYKEATASSGGGSGSGSGLDDLIKCLQEQKAKFS